VAVKSRCLGARRSRPEVIVSLFSVRLLPVWYLRTSGRTQLADRWRGRFHCPAGDSR